MDQLIRNCSRIFRGLNNRGLTFADLMMGLSILMIGISLLSIGIGVTRRSKIGTREATFMGSLASDVAERIMVKPKEIEGIVEWANERDDPNRNIDYLVTVQTRKNSVISEGGIDISTYRFENSSVIRQDLYMETNFDTSLTEVTVDVTYEGTEEGEEHEDDQKYQLTFFLLEE